MNEHNHPEFKKNLLELESQSRTLEGDINDWERNYLDSHLARYVKTLEYIYETNDGNGILEVGGAPGHITYLLNEFSSNIVTVDIDTTRIIDDVKRSEVEVLQCDIERNKLPFEDNSFDTVVFTEVFEHLRINPIHTVREIRRVLRTDGNLILSTPNKYRFGNIYRLILHQEGFMPNLYTEYKKLEEIGHMGHIREYSCSEVKKFLEDCGFIIGQSEFDMMGRGFGKGDNLLEHGLRNIGYLICNVIPSLRKYIVIIATPDK